MVILVVVTTMSSAQVSAFTVLPSHAPRGPVLLLLHRPTTTTTTTALAAKKKKKQQQQDDKPLNTGNPEWFDKLGPLIFTVPALFVAQIVFLAVAKNTSGLDNLTLYGELGNTYIRANGGYNPEKTLLERNSITSAGQKIWINNVLRDLQNGGPVYPPLDRP